MLTLFAMLASIAMGKGDKDVRLGCTAQLDGYYFNLHKLSKPIDE